MHAGRIRVHLLTSACVGNHRVPTTTIANLALVFWDFHFRSIFTHASHFAARLSFGPMTVLVVLVAIAAVVFPLAACAGDDTPTDTAVAVTSLHTRQNLNAPVNKQCRPAPPLADSVILSALRGVLVDPAGQYAHSIAASACTLRC